MKIFLLVPTIVTLDQFLKYLSSIGLLPYYKGYGSFVLRLIPGLNLNYIDTKVILGVYLLGLTLLLRLELVNQPKMKNLIIVLFLAGGLSNSFDRVFRGFVVDYLPMLGLTIINLADLSIIASLLLLSYHIIKSQKTLRRKY